MDNRGFSEISLDSKEVEPEQRVFSSMLSPNGKTQDASVSISELPAMYKIKEHMSQHFQLDSPEKQMALARLRALSMQNLKGAILDKKFQN